MSRRDRAWRRAQAERMKRRVVHYHGGYMLHLPDQERAAHVGIVARTPQRCSGPCCGNPRRWRGGMDYGGPRTIQERRAL